MNFKLMTAGLAGAAMIFSAGISLAADVTLRLHQMLPPQATIPAKAIEPWAKKVEAESKGRIKIELYPSMQLGGKPSELVDQVKDGVVDIIWTVIGYTPGRFPRSEVFELPFMGTSATASSMAFQEYYEKHMKNDFPGIHVIAVHMHGPGLLHMKDKPIEKLEDLKGKKLRGTSRVVNKMLETLGASAIGMPVPQVPESLAQRVIDGAVIPWEVVPSVKVQELVKFHTEIPGSPTFYVATFILAMNKAKYEALAPDLKAIIDRNSGAAAAGMAGKVWDEQAIAVSEMVRKRGNTITVIEEAEAARWRKTTEPVIEAWIKSTKEKGLDGEKLLASARAALAKHEKAA